MAAFKGLPERIRGFIGVGHDEMRYAATISIWARWFVCLVCLILPFYRPIEIPQARYVTYILILVLLVAFNAYLHYRLLWRRMATWHWMLVISALDVALITAAAVTSGGFTHYFFYLIYYPALALFAVVFSSFALNLAWATLVAAVYTTISFTVGDGLDFEAREDKTLFARIVIMYAVVGSVNLVARFERKGRMEAVVREQALLRDRIELSQTIHDTTAQSASMISLGIDAAIELAGESNQDLNATLAATSALSKAIMWELRHPIDAGISLRAGHWEACSGPIRRHSRRSRRSLPRWCSRGPSHCSARRSGPNSSLSRTTPSPTHFYMGEPIGWSSV